MAENAISLGSYSKLLRSNRNVRLLWLAQVISEMGDWFYAVAIYSLLLELTGSARSVALATVAMVFPQVLISPMAGVVNDRMRRKQVMIAADIARFFIVGSMIFAQSADRIWLIYVLMIAVPLGGISAWFLGLETGDIHALFANVLMVVALGHTAFALYHQYVVKDGLLRRMMKAG